MKIDTHVHSKNISLCAHVSYQDLIDEYAKNGFGAIILTNHYSKSFMEVNNVSYEDWLKLYINEYICAREYGLTKNVKVFLGAEVTLNNGSYADYLLFGVTVDFLEKFDKLFDYDQKSLYRLCKLNNILLFQAHPFRFEQNHTLQSMYYLDGLELNGHYPFTCGRDAVLAVTKIYDKLITCGGDVHTRDGIAQCGMIVPDNLSSSTDFRDYLLSKQEITYFGIDK